MRNLNMSLDEIPSPIIPWRRGSVVTDDRTAPSDSLDAASANDPAAQSILCADHLREPRHAEHPPLSAGEARGRPLLPGRRTGRPTPDERRRRRRPELGCPQGPPRPGPVGNPS